MLLWRTTVPDALRLPALGERATFGPNLVSRAEHYERFFYVNWLLGTMFLGTVFLVVKVFEYKHKWDLNHIPGPNFMMEGPHARQIEMFTSLYFGLTGLHALHMVIGVSILSVIAWMAHRRRFSPEWYTPVEISGLYWHFVDIVWIFLFPTLYLL